MQKGLIKVQSIRFIMAFSIHGVPKRATQELFLRQKAFSYARVVAPDVINIADVIIAPDFLLVIITIPETVAAGQRCFAINQPHHIGKGFTERIRSKIIQKVMARASDPGQRKMGGDRRYAGQPQL